MSLYADSDLPIRTKLSAAHEDTIGSFSQTGRWWNAQQRIAIVEHTRAARCEAGIQESTEPVVPSDAIPDAAARVARQVGVSTNSLDGSFVEQALADGLSEGQYCETVGLASRATNVDIFARAIDVPMRALSPPQSGDPSKIRPSSAMAEGAFLDTVPGGRRGKQDAIDIYGSNKVEGAPFIYRALSLVPEEAQGLIKLGQAQYLEIADFMDLNFTYEPSLARAQYELVAARVSAINACFY